MNSWLTFLQTEQAKPYYQALQNQIKKERTNYTIYPKEEDVFKAFELTPLEEVKVVLLGQDPYHEEGQAEGLAFSVPEGVKLPPSLKNLFKERETDLGLKAPTSGSLISWAKEGVLLLNTIMTVRRGEALSHQGMGWEIFTDAAIKACNDIKHRVVFILLGNDAIKKASLITNEWHYIIRAPHPSPLSAYRGFFGSHIYSRTNQALMEAGIPPVAW